jgi:hypothetical protein
MRTKRGREGAVWENLIVVRFCTFFKTLMAFPVGAGSGSMHPRSQGRMRTTQEVLVPGPLIFDDGHPHAIPATSAANGSNRRYHSLLVAMRPGTE